MKTIFTVLQDIEKLIYKVLMWIILIPKTVVRIILEPRWAAEYIRSELRDGASHFDEYVSPVILLLVVALLPALGYSALPKFGATLSSPAEANPSMDRFVSFDASADFISSADNLEYYVAWEVWKKNNQGTYEFENSDYHTYVDESDGGANIVRVDSNTIRDRFLYTFTPGEYLVYASVGNADTSQMSAPTLETYDAYLNVLVPDDPEAQVNVSSDNVEILDEKTTTSKKNFLDTVKDEQTIFLALALMIPPLLFAFASYLVKVRKLESVGEETLRESFYVQCYYFTPLSLAIWGTYYTYYFFTANAYWYVKPNTALQIILLPVVWAALWFIRTEVKRIAWELEVGIKEDLEKKPAVKKPEAAPAPEENPAQASELEEEIKVVVSKKNTIISSVIVLVCIAVLIYGANILVAFNTHMDMLRLFAIRAFPVLILLLIVGFAVSWFKRRKARQDDLIGWNVAGLVVLTLAFVVLMNRVNTLADVSTQPLNEAEAQVTSDWVSPATLEVAQVQPTIMFFPTLTLEVATGAQPTNSATPEITFTPVLGVTQTPLTDTPTPEPSATATAAPEVIPTATPSEFYTEEFDSAEQLSGWLTFMTFGDMRMVNQVLDAGKLSIGVTPLEEKYAWYYLVNNRFTYSNVKVTAVVTNQGNNANGVSLVCRYSEAGWYEFTLSNDGTYSIYSVTQKGYNDIANGGSARIKTGRQTNEYTAICSGNELTLVVNGSEVRKVIDPNFQLTDGKVGLAVSSMQKLPVRVEFESLTVSEP